MAIDDNTVYGLTGAQVKELPEKINAVKGMAKILTTADYNANSSDWSDTDPANFNTIALWKLEPGMYTISDDSPFDVYITQTYNIQAGDAKRGLFIIGKAGVVDKPMFYLNGSFNVGFIYRVNNYGSSNTGWRLTAPANSLTSFETDVALSAAQGKVLNEKIQALGNFSSAEVNTGTTWIDGSPIYKKTFGIGQLPNAGQSSTDPSISNVGTVIKIEGFAQDTSGLTYPLPMPGRSAVELWWSSGTLNCYAVGDRSNDTGYVTMYYTKSS